jgi:antitoxin (DNA-binding transcriptional repressor) of toxin-antitoxin stability system
MKSTTIRELKHDTTTVLGWVAAGESVEVLRRRKLVAVLSPPRTKSPPKRPDFAARLSSIYGSKMLTKTATDLIGDARGDS